MWDYGLGEEKYYVYIMPNDSPNDIKIDNVEKALRYMKTRMNDDKEIFDRLLNLSPKERRIKFA